MKRICILLGFTLFLAACGNGDKTARLISLKKQAEKLQEEIKLLESEIATEGISLDSLNASVANEKKTYVKVQRIEPSYFKHCIEIQGSVESDNNIFIPPQSPGIVQRIYVEKGDNVKKGQLLAELDGTIILKSIEQVKTGLELATTVFERQQRLWDQKIGSEIQYLQAKTSKESLEKQLAVLEEQYEMTKIISPLDGIVDEIVIKEGEAAAAGFGAIRVVNQNDLKVTASISEKYIKRVKKGDKAKVYIPTLEKELVLKISAVSEAINPDNRAFEIEIKLPDNTLEVKPNMLAIVSVKDYVSENALTIPLNVIQKTGEEKFIFLAKSNSDTYRAERRKIKAGIYYNNMVEILEGLKPMEEVIVSGYQDLADGQIVTITN